MKIGTTRALRGPNIWSQATVLETMIDLTSHVSLSAHDVDVIRDRVNQLLIGIVTPFRNDGCDEFNHSPRLVLAELLVRTALELQTQAGSSVSLARVAETKEFGHYKCVVQYKEELYHSILLDI